MDEDSSTEQKTWQLGLKFGEKNLDDLLHLLCHKGESLRVGGTALDTQETISFAQHPGVSNCECKCPLFRFVLFFN